MSTRTIAALLLMVVILGLVHQSAQATSRPSTNVPLDDQNATIRVGMLIPKNTSSPFAYSFTASAVTIAMAKVAADQILPPGINFTLNWVFEECNPATAIGYAFELFNTAGVDVLLSPPCTDAALVAGDVSTYGNLPMPLWGQSFATVLNDLTVYPSTFSVMPYYRE